MTKRSPIGIRCVLSALVVLAPLGAGFGQPEAAPAAVPPPAPSPAPGAPASLEFRVRPHVVAHAWARAALEGSAPAPPVAGAGDLVRSLEAVREALKNDERLWGLVDARVVASADAQSLVAVMESTPQTQKLSSGVEISLRDPGAAYARALKAVVEAWQKEGWDQVESQILGAREYVTGALAGAKQDPIAFIKSSMGWESWNGTVPVELVYRAPSPGGITFRGVNGPVCMVGLGEFEGSMRMEVLLHEAMHAIDVATDAPDAPLARLRKALTEAQIAPSDPAARNAWHTVFFVQAAETVRRTIDPNHKDYGELYAYYPRVGPLATSVRSSWGAYLDGTKTADEAIADIVATAKAVSDNAKPDLE